MSARDTDLRYALRCWAVAFLASAAVWTLAVIGCWHLMGCATGRIVRDDVEITCAAIGEDAKVTYSVPTGEAGIITSAPTQLVACEGGPIVPSLLDGVGTLLVSAGKLLFGWIVP